MPHCNHEFFIQQTANHYIASSNINIILWTSLLHDIDNLEKPEKLKHQLTPKLALSNHTPNSRPNPISYPTNELD